MILELDEYKFIFVQGTGSQPFQVVVNAAALDVDCQKNISVKGIYTLEGNTPYKFEVQPANASLNIEVAAKKSDPHTGARAHAEDGLHFDATGLVVLPIIVIVAIVVPVVVTFSLYLRRRRKMRHSIKEENRPMEVEKL